jgi:hypothetical protein
MRPDAARFIPPAAKGSRYPDEKLWNFHVPAPARRGSAGIIGRSAEQRLEASRGRRINGIRATS